MLCSPDRLLPPLAPFQFETLCVPNHTAWRFAEKTRFFRSLLAGGAVPPPRILLFFKGKMRYLPPRCLARHAATLSVLSDVSSFFQRAMCCFFPATAKKKPPCRRFQERCRSRGSYAMTFPADACRSCSPHQSAGHASPFRRHRHRRLRQSRRNIFRLCTTGPAVFPLRPSLRTRSLPA